MKPLYVIKRLTLRHTTTNGYSDQTIYEVDIVATTENKDKANEAIKYLHNRNDSDGLSSDGVIYFLKKEYINALFSHDDYGEPFFETEHLKAMKEILGD